MDTIKRTLEIINPIIEKDLEEKNNFPAGFTFFHILERVKLNLQSIYLLAKDSMVKHDHAIGLISRNLMTDFIVSGYIIKLFGSEEIYYNKLYSLYNSDIKKTKSIINMFFEKGFIDEDEKNKIEENFNNYSIYKVIHDFAANHNLKEFPNTKSIIEKFLDIDQNDEWIDQIKRSYDLWVYLSKYEHLGWYSYYLTRNTQSVKIKERLNSVLFKTLILTSSCLEILGEKRALKKIIELMEDCKEYDK